MKFPNVPRQGGPDWFRRIAEAVNHLLNRPSYFSLFVDGVPAADQQLLRLKIAQPFTINASASLGDAGVAATGSAVFTIKVSGSDVGTITFGAGQTTATVSITAPDVPALALFEVYAPNPADATLADITLSIAVAR